MRRAVTLVGIGLALLGCDRPPASGPAAPPPSAPPAVAGAESDAGTDAPKPEPPAPSTEQTARELVAAMEALGKLHTGEGGDCAGLATAIDTFANEHRELLARQSPAVHAWIDADEPTRTRLRAAMGQVMTGSMKCRDDSALKAVYAKLRAG